MQIKAGQTTATEVKIHIQAGWSIRKHFFGDSSSAFGHNKSPLYESSVAAVCISVCVRVERRAAELSYVELKPSGFFLITENRNTSTRHQTRTTASHPVVMAVKRRMAKKYFFEQVRYLCSWLPPNSWFCYLVITLRVVWQKCGTRTVAF